MIIVHDLNGKPYYQAIEYLANKGFLKEHPQYFESSILKLFLRAIIRGSSGEAPLARAVTNLILRLNVPFIKGQHIIIGMAPYDFRIVWYGLLAKKNNVVLHSSWPYWGGEKYPRHYGFLDILFKKAWRCFLNNSNIRIVAVTNQAKESIEDFASPKRGIHLIPHVVDRSIYFPADKALENTTINILFVGKLLPEKGIETISRLINKLDMDRFSFTFVGDGLLGEYVTNLAKQKNVRFLGWIKDKNELAREYRKNHILLVPSRRTQKWEELFGIVIAEAMATGLVVIASDHVGPRGLISNSITGYLLPENDIDKWGDLLVELADCPQKITRIGANASKEAEKYDIINVSRLWKTVLEFK